MENRIGWAVTIEVMQGELIFLRGHQQEAWQPLCLTVSWNRGPLCSHLLVSLQRVHVSVTELCLHDEGFPACFAFSTHTEMSGPESVRQSGLVCPALQKCVKSFNHVYSLQERHYISIESSQF